MSDRTPRFAAALLVAAVVHAAHHVRSNRTNSAMEGGMDQTRNLLGDIDRIVAARHAGDRMQRPIRLARRDVDRTIAAIDRIVEQQNSIHPMGMAMAASIIGAGHDAAAPCAEHGQLLLPFDGSPIPTLLCNATVTITGNLGSLSSTFASGTTFNNVRLTINAFTEDIGVSASFGGGGLNITSVESGDDQFVSVQQTAGDETCFVTLNEPDGEPADIDFGRTGVPADLDCDDQVGPSDLAIMLGQWGCTYYFCTADLNGDYDIDAEDLAILLANWTK